MSDARWEDSQRLEAWAGELRVNLLRSLGLIVFYTYHLINVYLIADGTITPRYQFQVSILFFLWSVLAIGLYRTLLQRYAPSWLKFLVVALDLAFVTLLCLFHPHGPHSPLMLLYFVVLASAPLRLSLHLVYTASLGALAGAGLVLLHWIYVNKGSEAYLANRDSIQVTPQTAIIFCLCLLTCGFFLGQIVRQMRRLLEGYAVEIQEVAEEIRQ